MHSHQEHLYALVAGAKATVSHAPSCTCAWMAATLRPPRARIHGALEAKLAEIGHGEISTIAGRYYAMDRDKRWERVQKAYDVMCRANGAARPRRAAGRGPGEL